MRRCKQCGAKLSAWNPADICFCHPRHPRYNPLERPPLLPALGTNLLNYAAANDECQGLHGARPRLTAQHLDEGDPLRSSWPSKSAD